MELLPYKIYRFKKAKAYQMTFLTILKSPILKISRSINHYSTLHSLIDMHYF